jgi:HK97 family phage major capsid protein
MFKLQADFLKEKGMTLEAFEGQTAEKQAEFFNELNKHNVTASNELAAKATKTDAEIEALKTVNLEASKQLESLVKAVSAQGVAISKGLEANENVANVTLKSQIKEHSASLKAIARRESGAEIELKAVVTGSIAPNSNSQLDPSIGQLDVRTLNLYNLFAKISLTGGNHNGTYRYFDWDEATSTRSAAMIAEGGTFPTSDAKWKQYTIDVKKVGDSLPVTEEFFEDEAMFASELEMFLRTNVDIIIDSQILLGDGTGNNITGIAATVPAFTAVNAGIADASIYDLIVKIDENISATTGNKYSTNFALMNIIDINKMKLKKDANNNYIMPPFVSRDGSVVSGVAIVENNGVVANTMYVGDTRFARIIEIGGLTMAKGEVNNQFLDDTMTLKVRKRLQFLIKNADKSGFRKVASISADLATIQA